MSRLATKTTPAIETLASKLQVPVESLTTQRETEILALPRAQKRTAEFKKAVFVASDTVFKGPYSADDEKLKLNLSNTALVQRIESWLGVESTVLPWKALLRDGRGRYYLSVRNVGDPKRLVWDVVSSKIETDVKVLRRGSFLRRVSEIEEEPLLVAESVWTNTLQHLYVIYLLGIGDHGSHNVLLRADGGVVGIDLEERRADRTPADRIDALFKKVFARHRAIYSSRLSKVKLLDRPLSRERQAELLALGCAPAGLEKRRGAFLTLR